MAAAAAVPVRLATAEVEAGAWEVALDRAAAVMVARAVRQAVSRGAEARAVQGGWTAVAAALEAGGMARAAAARDTVDSTEG